ncbi:hypothetical protein GEMRC1_008101 [Eukaryota sp. GEM-RC1]
MLSSTSSSTASLRSALVSNLTSRSPKQDVVIIGGGPGGYVSAIRAAQLGFKTTCVEKRGALGGTCLTEGCIPSKALLHSSHLYEECHKADVLNKKQGKKISGVADHGISVSNVSLDLKKMMARKNKVVRTLDKGIEMLFKKNGVNYIKGNASLSSPSSVSVQTSSSPMTIPTDRIIIATGSSVATLPCLEIDEKQVVSNKGALSLPRVPKKMIVIGGGVIGLELGSVWRRLGSDVTVVEFGDRVCPFLDADVSDCLQKELKKQGMKFMTGTGVVDGEKTSEEVKLIAKNRHTGKTSDLSADVVLVSIGRRPNFGGLVTSNQSDFFDVDRGAIVTNDRYQTKHSNVFAIGDVIGGNMLAHKAEEEGVALVEGFAGMNTKVNYKAIPSVIYTDPEVACVGMTELEARRQLNRVKVGKFNFSGNSRAKAVGDTAGFVKVIADEKDVVRGFSVIGPSASELIMQGTYMVANEMTLSEVLHTCHPHPCYSEAVKEAAMMAKENRAIHA